MTTSKRVASDAAKMLKSKKSTTKEREVAGAALEARRKSKPKGKSGK